MELGGYAGEGNRRVDRRTLTHALTGITDERGVRYATWTYDARGRVLTSGHAGGADSFTFSYDDVNNKRTVTNPLSSSRAVSA